MTIFTRCYICDYSETEGSDFGDIAPGANGIIRQDAKSGRCYCEPCWEAVFYNYRDLAKKGNTHDSSDRTTPDIRLWNSKAGLRPK